MNISKYNYIGIDFEYVADGDDIKHLICCVMHGANGSELRFWLRNGQDTYKLKRTLEKMKRGTGYVFVAHAMELAEARCFTKLGMDPLEFDWRDTWMEAKILTNSFFQNALESCSLIECIAKYLTVQLDPEYKKECRGWCIMDSTEGHEAEILDYCASDTKYLPQLADRLYEMYRNRIEHSIYIHKQCVFTEQTLIDLAYMINCSSEIAHRGFPVDNEALSRLQEHVPEMVLQLKKDFNEQYKGTFVFSNFKGKIKATKKFSAIYSHLEKFLAERNMLDEWERTANGSPSTDSALLKQFKRSTGFGADYYNLMKTLTSVQGLAKDKDPWLANWVEVDERIYYGSLRPMSSATGRFQPRISAGFIPGWAHFLYCVLNPQKGKMIFEWDFHAQETALQAIICHDPKYAEVYNARDTYLWMAWQLGQITEEQYNEMQGQDSEWKKKYGSIRGPMKTFTLAWSYGAGAKHLAELAGIPLVKAEQWVHDLDFRIFKNAYKYKRHLVDATTASTRYHGLCFSDGFCCRTIRYAREVPKSDTTKMNWPFQGFGAFILRELVKKCHELNLPAIATVHDAIIFECDEGDWDTVRKCRDVMEQTAKELLGSDLLNCGKREKEGERPNAAVWYNHTLSDILDADLRTAEERGFKKGDDGYDEACQQFANNVKAFRDKVGDLVEIDDVKKFQKMLTDAIK